QQQQSSVQRQQPIQQQTLQPQQPIQQPRSIQTQRPQQQPIQQQQQQQQQQPSTPTTSAVFLRRQDVDAFRYDYENLLKEVDRVEVSGDFASIVRANYSIYRYLSGYLDKVRKTAQGQRAGSVAAQSSGDNVLVAVRDIRSLEMEAEYRFLRAIFARNAMNSGLGNSVISAVGQQTLYRDLEKSLSRLNEKGADGDDDADDESNEERNFASVNLSKSQGLYSIRDTSEAFGINELVGYASETNELLNYCRDVRLVLPNTGGDGASASGNNIAGGVSRNPTCVILYGPPGTGKTTVAQAVAKHLDYIYMYVNAENIISSWAGGTEKNIAKLFRRARIASLQNRGRKVLMLIDEIDGLLKNRATNPNLTGEEYNRITTFLQMLTPPVGVDNSKIVGIFTTNLLSNLEPAFVARCKGRIFMGYIVDPRDRATLMQKLFSPWIFPRPAANVWINLALVFSDFVPRDLQNVLSSIKNYILQKAQSTQSIRVDTSSGFEYVDLSQTANLVEYNAFESVLASTEPATNTRDFFNLYNPPVLYICRWLQANTPNARSYNEFLSRGRDLCPRGAESSTS
ncbi:hypothetical protein KPH14_013119, partial [Odynerus spinipes]